MCVCVYIYIYMYILLRRHVPSGLEGCNSFPPSPLANTGHRSRLWFAERNLVLQISPTPEQYHIFKPWRCPWCSRYRRRK